MLDRLPRRSIPESHPPPWSPPSSSLGGSLSQTELFRRSLLELHQEGYGIDDIDASVECDSGTSVAEAGGDALDEERKRVEEREMAVGRSSPDTVLDTGDVHVTPSSFSNPYGSTMPMRPSMFSVLARASSATVKPEANRPTDAGDSSRAASPGPRIASTVEEPPSNPLVKLLMNRPSVYERHLAKRLRDDDDDDDVESDFAAPSLERFGSERQIGFELRPSARSVLREGRRLGASCEIVWPNARASLGMHRVAAGEYALRVENVDRRPCVVWGKCVISACNFDERDDIVVSFGTRSSPTEYPLETAKPWIALRRFHLSPLDASRYEQHDGSLRVTARLTFHAPLHQATHSYSYDAYVTSFDDDEPAD